MGRKIKEVSEIEVSELIHLRVDRYTQRLLKELLETGDFESISNVLRIAVIELHKKYEREGRLAWQKTKEQAVRSAEPIKREIEID